MATATARATWEPGGTPVAVVMISLNEGHNLEGALRNLRGWAQEVFLVDSYSQDDTIEIALQYGIHVVQRRFSDFGDQWNFAVQELPIAAPWTMKLDPDERLSDELKVEIAKTLEEGATDGIVIKRRLWFMNRPLSVSQPVVRVWRTGACRFSSVAVNEHPIVNGRLVEVRGEMEHHDSPNLDHWMEKQNRYTTAEAVIAFTGAPLAEAPSLFGSALQRRMWFKKNFRKVPGRFLLLFLYHWLIQGAWRAGRVGWVWARLRTDVMRLIEYKRVEMEITGRIPVRHPTGPGNADPRVPQYEQVERLAAGVGIGQGTASAAVRFHDRLATDWSSQYEKGGFRRRLESVRGAIGRNVRRGDRWVDLGCGSGMLARELARGGASIVAVDGSPRMLQEARRLLAKEVGADVVFIESDVQSVPELASGGVDGILCSSVAEYVMDPSGLLREAARLLRPGGRLIMTVPPKGSPVRVLQKATRAVAGLLGRDVFPYLAVSRFEIEPARVPRWFGEAGLAVRHVGGFDPILGRAAGRFLRPSLLIVEAEKTDAERPEAGWERARQGSGSDPGPPASPDAV